MRQWTCEWLIWVHSNQCWWYHKNHSLIAHCAHVWFVLAFGWEHGYIFPWFWDAHGHFIGPSAVEVCFCAFWRVELKYWCADNSTSSGNCRKPVLQYHLYSSPQLEGTSLHPLLAWLAGHVIRMHWDLTLHGFWELLGPFFPGFWQAFDTGLLIWFFH